MENIVPANFVDEPVIPANFIDKKNPAQKTAFKGAMSDTMVDVGERVLNEGVEVIAQLLVKEPIKFAGSLAAGLSNLAGKPFVDPAKTIGKWAGVSEGPGDTGGMGYSKAFTGGMESGARLMDKIPFLEAKTEAQKSVIEGWGKMMSQFTNWSQNQPFELTEKYKEEMPGLKALYDKDPAAWDTIAASVPGTLEWLSLLIGVRAGKVSLADARKMAEASKKGPVVPEPGTSRMDSVMQGEKKPTELLPERGQGIQGEFPGLGEEQMQRAPQYGSEGPGGFKSIDENGMPIDARRQQEFTENIAGKPLEDFTLNGEAGLRDATRQASKDNTLYDPTTEPMKDPLLNRAEMEQSQRTREYELANLKKLEEDRLWADKEVETVNTSNERQRQLEARDGSGEVAHMFTAGGKTKAGGFGDLMDRMFGKIELVPTDRLTKIHEGLKSRVEKIDFSDNSPESMTFIEQELRVSGELARRTNDDINARHPTQGERIAAHAAERERAGTTIGRNIDYTRNRDSGYETNHTGEIIAGGSPEHVYVRDKLSGEVHRLNPWDVDRVYSGPASIRFMNTFGPKMNRDGGNFIADLFFGNMRIRADEVLGKLEEYLPKTHQTADINVSFSSQLANAHWRSQNRALYALDTDRSLSSLMALWWDNQLRHWVKEGHDLNAEAIYKANVPYQQYYRLAKAGTKTDLWVRDVKALNHMENNPHEWYVKGGAFYPDAAYLESKGMHPDSVAIWESIFEIEGKMFDRINTSLTNNGRANLPRIPGYLHHEWTGPYRVEMIREHTDPKTGKVTEEYIGKIGSFSRKKQEAAYQAILQKAQANGITLRKVDPQAIANDKYGAIAYYQNTLSALDGSPGLKSLVERLHDSALEGIITESMTRKDPATFGYSLERATMDPNSALGLSKKEMKKAMDMFRRHFEEVNDFYIRSKFVQQTMIPLVETGLLEKFPNLNKFVTEATAQFVGLHPNAGNTINAALRNTLIKTGLDPSLATHAVQGLSKAASLVYLFGSLPYYIANMVQRTYSIQYARTLHRTREALGAETGDFKRAYFDAMKEMNFFKKIDINNKSLPPYILDGIKHGYIEPGFNKQFADPLSGHAVDVVSSSIERRNRVGPYAVGYHYFKQFMSHEEAVHAAGKMADGIGVTYNPKFGPQLAYQGLPDILKPIGMFTNFASHTQSLINNQVATAALLAKGGNIKGAVAQIADLASWQLTQIALFGVGGVSLVGNLDNIIRALTNLTGDYIPTVEDLTLKLNEYLPRHMKSVLSKGAISTTLGYDVSSSGGGANWAMPTAFANATISAAMHVLLAGKWLSYQAKLNDKPVTLQDWADVARTAPQRFQMVDEYLIKSILSGSWDPAVVGKTSLAKKVTDQGVKQTPLDAWVRFGVGLKSMNVVTDRMAERLTDNEAMALKGKVSSIIESAAIRGYANERELQNLSKIASEYGPEYYETLINAIIEGKMSSLMDKTTKKAFDAMPSIEKQKFYQKYLDRKKQTGVK